MPDLDAALAYAGRHHERFVDELFDLLRIPSVSTDPARAGDVRRCAGWLADHLAEIGLDAAEVVAPSVPRGHPVVFASQGDAPDRPTLLVYGHYDVQPPDPVEAWTSPPFEPVVRDRAVFARGASDDKGPLFLVLKAVEACLRTGGLPVNLRVVLEGEEEAGSASFAPFLGAYRDRLAADAALVCDTAMAGEGLPALVVALRGIVYVEVEVVGPSHDLHSGVYGGAVANPLNVLARLLACLQGDEGRILVPGITDDVRALTADERASFEALPFDEAAFLAETGAPALESPPGVSVAEATTALPSLDVHGLWGGYAGEGVKTVLPSRAGAKLSVRLVPDQDPGRVVELLRAHLVSQAPASVRVTVSELGGAPRPPPGRHKPDAPRGGGAGGDVRARAGVRPDGRVHSHRRRPPGGARRGPRDDGVRAGGGRDPRPGRALRARPGRAGRGGRRPVPARAVARGHRPP